MQTQTQINAINRKKNTASSFHGKGRKHYTTTASASLSEKQYLQTKTSPTLVNISVTSDHIPMYKEYHQQFVNAIKSGNISDSIQIRNEVTQHLQQKIKTLIPNTAGELSHILGIWDSGFEQSFKIAFTELTDDILHAMVKVAKHFEQEAIHFIRPVQYEEITRPLGVADEKGNVFTSVWEFFLKAPLELTEFQAMIGKSGLMGAQLSENGKIITIYNSYNAEQAKDKESSEEATKEWEIKATAFAQILQQQNIEKANIGFGEFRSYGKSLQSGTRTYDELELDVITSKQYRQRLNDQIGQAKRAA